MAKQPPLLAYHRGTSYKAQETEPSAAGLMTWVERVVKSLLVSGAVSTTQK